MPDTKDKDKSGTASGTAEVASGTAEAGNASGTYRPGDEIEGYLDHDEVGDGWFGKKKKDKKKKKK